MDGGHIEDMLHHSIILDQTVHENERKVASGFEFLQSENKKDTLQGLHPQ